MTDITLRTETPDDYREVEHLTREAFWNVYGPGCAEHYLLHRMRQSPDFISALDIVAECGGRLVGSAACACARIEGDDGTMHRVVTLGPLSVLPAFQRRGIGRKLTDYVVCEAGRLGWPALLLCGDPLLYARYGFEPAARYGIRTADNKITPALHVRLLAGSAPAELSGRYVESGIYEIDTGEVEAFDRHFPPKEKIADTSTQLRFREILMMQEDFVPDPLAR